MSSVYRPNSWTNRSRLTDPVPPKFVRELPASTVHHSVPEPFFEQVVAECLKRPASVWPSVLDGLLAYDDAADLGRITAPTLIIWGERDE
jgi:non-heme chloroperoxidase